MDLSELERLEQQQVGKLKLSEAIRIGARMVKEDRQSYCGCALAAAYAGFSGGRSLSKDGRGGLLSEHRLISRNYGVPLDLLERIEDMHYDQRVPSLQIADWLATQGL